ncbi:MAG TPA: spore cortex-lytic enzyme [Candidatus Scatomorpha intestinavium]|uniref:Spore cortex-lytic enzyme n=1 Tax=Candidatus Scatomorpha intestinavium TaxID=2840922 RepID=A0A9D0ZER4_9FIRM|nr:spore cortex-lytic enzyme [Candidatus Scatomorpha intestinavium]
MTDRKKLILALTAIFTLNIMLIALAQAAGAATYERGSSGELVSEMQSRLKEWGYYSGEVDGIFGSETEEAVKAFQRKNGLEADGRVGPATLTALGLPTGQQGEGAESGDLALLARLISAEARGEPYTGQVAVGAVVMNRVEHPSFPNSISGVIYQPGAFSCLQDGQWDEPVADSAYRAAREALAGADPTGGAIYYFNPQTATSEWIWSRPEILTIGNHRFCA